MSVAGAGGAHPHGGHRGEEQGQHGEVLQGADTQTVINYNKNTILLQVSNAGVTLPSAFTRERNNVKRKGIFRPRSMVIEDETNTHTSPASPGGYFTQQHTDAKIFMEEHFMVSQRSLDSEVYLDLLSPGEDLTLSLVPPDCQERQPMAQLQEDAAKVWETTF